MGTRGRRLDTSRAARPDMVGATMQAAPTFSAVCTAAMPTAKSTRACTRCRSGGRSSNRYASLASAMRAIMRAASSG